MLIISGLVGLAPWGCWLGRWLGPRLRTCPYRLSAQLAAALPIIAGLIGLDSLGRLQAVAVGLGALLGVFASGHGSRARALLFCVAGAVLGAALGLQLG